MRLAPAIEAALTAALAGLTDAQCASVDGTTERILRRNRERAWRARFGFWDGWTEDRPVSGRER